MQLQLVESENGTAIPVRLKPRARHNAIEGVREGALLVAVTAPPSEGAANAALLELLAKKLKCAKTSLHLQRGSKSRAKIVLCPLTCEEITARLNLAE